MNRTLATYDAAEERNKLSHFTVQGFDLNGVIHVGANDGEEVPSYVGMGIQHLLMFEPLNSARELCEQREVPIGTYYTVSPYALSDFDGEETLRVTAGDGKGSSFMDVNLEHPEVKRNWNQGQSVYVGEQKCQVRRFDTWVKEEEFDISNFDTLLLDTQGNEWEVLHGMGDLLKQFKYLCVEISEIPIYDKEHSGQEISDWLDTIGFLRDSPITAHNDTFFIRKDIKSVTDGLYKGRC